MLVQFTVTFRPFRNPGEMVHVIATASPSAGNPGKWFATAPGAGCSKDFDSAALAVRNLISDDLGEITSIEARA